MVEVEIKARVKDINGLINSLAETGFRAGETVTQTDEYFCGVDRDFGITDEALRIRATSHEGRNEYAITYKGPKLDKNSKTRVEYETKIADPEVMRELLCALGHKSAYVVKKRRAYYYLNDITACVDNIDGLGDFLELETDGGDAGRLFGLLNSLGIDKSACMRESYLELLLELR